MGKGNLSAIRYLNGCYPVVVRSTGEFQRQSQLLVILLVTGYPPARTCLRERRAGGRPWITLHHIFHRENAKFKNILENAPKSPTRFPEDPRFINLVDSGMLKP